MNKLLVFAAIIMTSMALNLKNTATEKNGDLATIV